MLVNNAYSLNTRVVHNEYVYEESRYIINMSDHP